MSEQNGRCRPRAERGTLAREPERYGESAQGRPLELWRGREHGGVLVVAGLHGEEPETVVTLSSALRSLGPDALAAHVVLAANPDGLARGTRCNAEGVDLNRNFPASDWSAEPPCHHFTRAEPQDVRLSSGPEPASEPETRALMALVDELRPRATVGLHAPLGSVLDPEKGALARWLATRSGLPLRRRVASPTPGMFDTWVRESIGVPAVTLELPVISKDRALVRFVPLLTALLAGEV